MSFQKKIKSSLINFKSKISVHNKTKIFGIGANKTGTTSLKTAMKELNFTVGNQRVAKKHVMEWSKRDFNGIIKFCKTAQFFQDVPYSYPYTYIALDQAFPNSKFILTIRDNPEQWYNSVVNYIGKKWASDGKMATKEDLQNAMYIRKGWLWESMQLVREIDENDIFNKDQVIQRYLDHNKNVIEYFKCCRRKCS